MRIRSKKHYLFENRNFHQLLRTNTLKRNLKFGAPRVGLSLMRASPSVNGGAFEISWEGAKRLDLQNPPPSLEISTPRQSGWKHISDLTFLFLFVSRQKEKRIKF